jgi:hypothetical protein
MKKKVIAVSAAFVLSIGFIAPAHAHVGTQMRGNSLVAGASSRVYLSLGHGCTYKEVQYATHIFSVEVPAAAGKPTPEFHQGFRAKVVASREVNAANVPAFYTVTWTAKSSSWAIDPNTFYDFGLKVKWDKSPQKIAFKTTQQCSAYDTSTGSRKALYMKWHITDGSTMAATADTEFGPAPTVTTVAS